MKTREDEAADRLRSELEHVMLANRVMEEELVAMRSAVEKLERRNIRNGDWDFVVNPADWTRGKGCIMVQGGRREKFKEISLKEYDNDRCRDDDSNVSRREERRSYPVQSCTMEVIETESSPTEKV